MAVLVGLIMLAVLHFNIVPSPTPSVLLKPYQKVWFPDFDLLFETPSGCVSQTSVGRILEGGGLLGSVSTANRFDSGLAEVTFEIHLIVFVDGEIAGPDPNRFAAELQGRKRAAEFVAKRIRMAQAEGSDVTPILTALAEAPSLGALGSPQCDPLFHSVQHYARE